MEHEVHLFPVEPVILKVGFHRACQFEIASSTTRFLVLTFHFNAWLAFTRSCHCSYL